ncbi:unnamed protein product [Spirodela intermedia]|uniref:Uncharacterized protein n=1 Tax=Spirodela intermedia TaxID=51605 RepID=A0ABN7E8K2_SPIIN|nr:unnamed protein product [Spirodela intermedia]
MLNFGKDYVHLVERKESFNYLKLLVLYYLITFLKSTTYFLEFQLADGSTRQPYGLSKDVIVKIKSCYFTINLIVADIKVTEIINHALIILINLS